MTASVRIQIPNTGHVLEGVLIALDKAAMRLTMRVESGVETIRPNMLAQAILTIGGAPRQLTVQLQPLDTATIALIPVSAAQCCERRARKRYTVNMATEIATGAERITVRVVNISIAGLGFQASQPLEVGQEFTIILPLLGKEEALQAQGQVRHCRELQQGLWYIGAAFKNLSRADELWLRKLFP